MNLNCLEKLVRKLSPHPVEPALHNFQKVYLHKQSIGRPLLHSSGNWKTFKRTFFLEIGRFLWELLLRKLEIETSYSLGESPDLVTSRQ